MPTEELLERVLGMKSQRDFVPYWET